MCEADQLSSSLDPKTKGEYEAKLAMLEKELENQVRRSSEKVSYAI